MTKFGALVYIINYMFELKPEKHYHSTRQLQNIQFIFTIYYSNLFAS